MKICPNCEAENDDENSECFLCGFEFDDEEVDSEYSDEENDFFDDSPEQDIEENDSADYESEENGSSLQTSTPVYSAAAFQSEEPVAVFEGYYETPKSKSKIIIVIVVILILIASGILFYDYYNQKNNSNDFAEETTSETSETIKVIESSVVETENEPDTTEATTMTMESTTITEPKTEPPLPNIQNMGFVGNTLEEMYNIYLFELLFDNDELDGVKTGYLYDFDNDGIDEMILRGSKHYDNYMIYYYNNGNLIRDYFGSYMELADSKLFSVTGYDGNSYIYYKDEYAYKSIQGYYMLYSKSYLDSVSASNNLYYLHYPENSLAIFIDYPYISGNYYADWHLSGDSGDDTWYNWRNGYKSSTEFSSGYELVDTFYAQPPQCHDELMSALPRYGFSIDENSNYNKIESIPYNELKNKLFQLTGNSLNYDFINQSDFKFSGFVKTDGSTLNLRAAPSTSSDVIMELPNGIYYDILDIQQDWYKIEVIIFGQKYSGYISSEFGTEYMSGI